MTVERDWFWFWFWFYYALWLASVFTLVLVLRQSSENRSKGQDVNQIPGASSCSERVARTHPHTAKKYFKNVERQVIRLRTKFGAIYGASKTKERV